MVREIYRIASSCRFPQGVALGWIIAALQAGRIARLAHMMKIVAGGCSSGNAIDLIVDAWRQAEANCGNLDRR